MDREAGEFEVNGKEYRVQFKKPFRAYAQMSQEDKDTCFSFAYDMSYGKRGAHRDHRSGGTYSRTPGHIFINTFQGKMAEFALYRYLESKGIKAGEPDIATYDLGRWDSFDLECQGKHISVKSTKFFGDLLLLETKDWDAEGRYTPNLTEGGTEYDYMVLVRLKPNSRDNVVDAEKLMGELLRQRGDEIPGDIRERLEERVRDIPWEYDFAGFIYQSELVRLIRERRILPQGSMLNGRMRMDAENYYFQAGNMHDIKELYLRDIKEETDERASLRLKRRCPECKARGEEKNLVLRHGYSWFWGCEGFRSNPQCKYQERI